MDIARLATSRHCHQVVVLDVRGISPITDFFVLATGTSNRQMKTVCDEAGEVAEARGYSPLTQSGQDTGGWVVVDYFDAVFHLFTQEMREYYDLDGLWADAPRIDWEAATSK